MANAGEQVREGLAGPGARGVTLRVSAPSGAGIGRRR
jgi:hypothetical protein